MVGGHARLIINRLYVSMAWRVGEKKYDYSNQPRGEQIHGGKELGNKRNINFSTKSQGRAFSNCQTKQSQPANPDYENCRS
jgi:hypothetical protein